MCVCVCDLRREGVDINFLERGRVFTFLIFLYNDKVISKEDEVSFTTKNKILGVRSLSKT